MAYNNLYSSKGTSHKDSTNRDYKYNHRKRLLCRMAYLSTFAAENFIE
ncbi:hypothetical protein PORCRE_1442 [Porphyromonas crevioricanis JCM 15906]|uniref:Uncharacterized protein n=1 Tax=Porphyromonas crevioricanis JCM 15906 TaxID=1305617 RepID=T1DSJ2_9PORP|nr:hypothetical protein PORCRE_1442 [Porphyromonas crevioricanis JCM 15906]GAD07507.1 hypothetical protein PORCAN_1128 [Porphyromonas crevioricanis JCM 13913]